MEKVELSSGLSMLLEKTKKDKNEIKNMFMEVEYVHVDF
jgi:hypothetical protein